MCFGFTTSAWPEQASRNFKTNPAQPKPMRRRRMAVYIPLEVTTNYHARAKRFTASLPRDRALAILKKTNEAGRPMWTEGVRGPEAGMVIHQIMVERAQAWVWHEKPRERQPTAASQPPPATEFHLQPDFTPRAVDTWATEIRRGRMLCQTYQQNQY